MAASSTPSDKSQKRCCLQSCIHDLENGVIGEDCMKVEVKSFEPKKKKDTFLVNWEADGSAVFHSKCWNSLVKATKGNDESLGSVLMDIERSMILEANKTAEFHDSDSAISDEAAHIATILKTCGYCIAFTGAGISTAAGIADFRGPNGQWTKRDRDKNYGASTAKSKAGSRAATMEQLRPTYTHEALNKLQEIGLLKFIISQNTDGLHILSGVPKVKIAELHGNSFVERCEECGTVNILKHHYRHGNKGTVPSAAAQVKCKRCKCVHRTGRKCKQLDCNGYLMNTIINFGDYLESEVIDTAEHHAKMADAVLVLGSSLRVSPANDLVLMGKEPQRIVICNRQTTSYDNKCRQTGEDGKQLGARAFCDCDKLMKNIMQKVLSPSELKTWEGERDVRMAEYQMKRSAV